MFRKSVLKVAIIFALSIFIASCTIPVRTVVRGPLLASDVPPNFDPEKHVLLVATTQRLDKPEEIDKKSARKLEKALRENFPYRYEIVTKKDIYENPERYSDTAIYRYALVGKRKVLIDEWTLEGELEEGISFSPGFRRTYIDFAFYNRVDKVHYPFSGSGTSVMKIAINNVATRINKALALRATDHTKSETVVKAKQTMSGAK